MKNKDLAKLLMACYTPEWHKMVISEDAHIILAYQYPPPNGENLDKSLWPNHDIIANSSKEGA